MTPSIDIVKKLANLLNSTVGYLLGETEEDNILKEPEILNRFKEIDNLDPNDKERIFFTLDALIHEINNKKRYANS
ncbi:hypothetical protein [Apibacter sp.]|uniref:hypothetical protein n=1 Tax=Apibacter sp. TaxID=2023709 RepID=UPI0025E67A2B|nr:hypothetical protein [Apibacter sp.]MCT6869983.1 hypothetical protein [Apibacter sp.]